MNEFENTERAVSLVLLFIRTLGLVFCTRPKFTFTFFILKFMLVEWRIILKSCKLMGFLRVLNLIFYHFISVVHLIDSSCFPD